MLGLATYLLVLLLGMWWQGRGNPGWVFTWQTWAAWEPLQQAAPLVEPEVPQTEPSTVRAI